LVKPAAALRFIHPNPFLPLLFPLHFWVLPHFVSFASFVVSISPRRGPSTPVKPTPIHQSLLFPSPFSVLLPFRVFRVFRGFHPAVAASQTQSNLVKPQQPFASYIPIHFCLYFFPSTSWFFPLSRISRLSWFPFSPVAVACPCTLSFSLRVLCCREAA
jgi:hypothetical protein